MSKQNRTIEASADLFDGKGSIATRISKLRHLQSLGFVDKNFDFPRIAAQPDTLAAVEHFALVKARDASKKSGVLISHTVGNDPRLQTTTYEGDPEACWAPFKHPGFSAKINKEVGIREETVKLKPGERVMIVNAEGKEVADAGKETTNREKPLSTHAKAMKDPQLQELMAKQHRKDIDELKNPERPSYSN